MVASNQIPEPIRLVVALRPDGTIGVAGPISDPPLCLHMLGGAMQAIANEARKRAEMAVKVAPEAALRILDGPGANGKS